MGTNALFFDKKWFVVACCRLLSSTFSIFERFYPILAIKISKPGPKPREAELSFETFFLQHISVQQNIIHSTAHHGWTQVQR